MADFLLNYKDSRFPVEGAASGSVLVFCHAGDNICEANGQLILLPHLTYVVDAPQAADFVVSRTT
jgi:hypothetical protein